MALCTTNLTSDNGIWHPTRFPLERGSPALQIAKFVKRNVVILKQLPFELSG